MANDDIASVEAIAKIVRDFGLEKIEYSKDGINIVVCNSVCSNVISAVPQQIMNVPNGDVKIIAETKPNTNKGEQIKSPMVGVLYLSPSPDEQPYVKVGDRVNVGDVLCLIEAMKTFNQIKSTQSGIVREILVTSGTAVEYDEPLFVIE